MSDENKRPTNEEGINDELVDQPDEGQQENEKEDHEQKEELEKIAQLFEQEYEKAREQLREQGYAAAEQEQLDPQWDEDSHEYPLPEESEEAEPCAYCGENPRDLELSVDNDACAQCRLKFARYPLPFKGFLAIFVVVVALLFSGFHGARYFFYDVQIAQADKLDRANYLEESADVYFRLTEKIPQKDSTAEKSFYSPLRVTRKVIEMLELIGQPNLIPEIYENLPEYALKLPQYKHLTTLKEQSEVFVSSLQNSYAVVGDYVQLSGEDFPYDDVIFELDELLLFGDDEPYPEHRKAAVLYYKYNSAILAHKGLDEQVKFLGEIEQLLPDTLWLYAEYLGYGYARLGEYEKASEISNRIKNRNASTATPYVIDAAVYRMQQDYEKALLACDEGQQVNPQNSYEVVRQKAIVLLLEGKAGEAVAEFKEIAGINQTILNYDTLAICAIAADDSDTFDEIADLYESINAQQGLEVGDAGSLWFSQSVLDYQNGDIGLEDIFLTGMADVF